MDNVGKMKSVCLQVNVSVCLLSSLMSKMETDVEVLVIGLDVA